MKDKLKSYATMSSENKSDFFGLEHVTIKEVMDAMKIQTSDLFQIKWLTLFLQIYLILVLGCRFIPPMLKETPCAYFCMTIPSLKTFITMKTMNCHNMFPVFP